MKQQTYNSVLAIALFSCVSGVEASTWSDTALGIRYGSSFAEPFNNDDISKKIINLTHSSGYAYGVNFFNVDLLMSDNKDPAFKGSSDGAQETYVVYRNTLDLGKLSGKPDSFSFGKVRGTGITFGFDWNSKDDAGYNSKKQMLVVGPTLMFDVPGFLNLSLLGLWESNAPYDTFSGTGVDRYDYDAHPAVDIAWSIPFTLGVPLSFNGYFDYIFEKGKNEFGGDTAAEIHTDIQIMYAINKSFKVGAEYEYWKNKFGNDSSGPAGKGAFAKTPMLRLEYHF